MDLILRESYPLDTSEKQEINNKLDKLISESKNNTEIIQDLMSQAVSLATSVEARADVLKNQGLLGRLLGDIIGSNHKTSANNQKDLAKAQFISQQLLVKLSEQNAITLNMVEDLALKVHSLAGRQTAMVHEQDEIKNEIANVHALLEHFFIKIRDRFDRIENDVQLNRWRGYIVDFEILGDKTYCQLSLPARLICLVNEFFNLTKGRWDKKELAMLKGAMRLVDVDPKAKTSAIEIFQSYQEEPQLLNKLHEDIISHDDFVTSTYDSEYLIGFTRLDYLRNQGKDNFKELVRLIGDKTAQELEISAVTNEILWAGGSNPAEPQSAFSIVETLLHDLKNIQTITKEGTVLPQLPEGKSYPSRRHLEYKIMKPEELKMHADNDNALAQYFYGKHLEKIDEDTELYEEMYLYYLMAAEQGLSDANYELGECYYYGNGVEDDEPHAFEYYNRATVSGDVIKTGQHADHFTNEFMKKDDPIKQAKWTMLVAKMGRRRSMLELGKLYQDGIGIKKDIKKGFAWIQKSADAGLNDAYFELSECYRLGKGVEKNNSLALVYCHFAQIFEGEDSNDYNHHYFETYWNDESLDSGKFFSICSEVADSGDSIGQYCLSRCYVHGWGADENEEMRMEWIFRSAENGLMIAKEQLLEKYCSIESGYKELLDYEVSASPEYETYVEYAENAIELAQQLFLSGSVSALSRLSNLYRCGIGHLLEPIKGLDFMRAAARLGDEAGMASMAMMHEIIDVEHLVHSITHDNSNAIFWNRLCVIESKIDSLVEDAESRLEALGYQ